MNYKHYLLIFILAFPTASWAQRITDFYAFVSYDDPSKVTFILNVTPGAITEGDPNLLPFDDAVHYKIHIDNTNSGADDVAFQFQFETENRSASSTNNFVGSGSGILSPANSPPPIPPERLIIPPAITDVHGTGAMGLNYRQHYSVVMIKNGESKELPNVTGKHLYAAPPNVGPNTMPDYPSLAAKTVYEVGEGIRVFAGVADNPYFADTGALYDTLNFRTGAGGGFLSPAQDANDLTNTAPDLLSGTNVNTIAIEVPISLLTKTGARIAANRPGATIGAWATLSRPRNLEFRGSLPPLSAGGYVQIDRMGNPFVKDWIVNSGDRTSWAASTPKEDAQFVKLYADPTLARQLNAIYGIDIPPPPRSDLDLLLNYMAPVAAPGTGRGPVADLLRLNTGISSTPEPSRRRLGILAGDSAGFPNGRRLSDDAVDITLRLLAGFLVNPRYEYALGDGVNTNDVRFQETFPYVGWAQDGRNRRHIDPGEAGCTQGGGSACALN